MWSREVTLGRDKSRMLAMTTASDAAFWLYYCYTCSTTGM
jgi:hypothetical protein